MPEPKREPDSTMQMGVAVQKISAGVRLRIFELMTGEEPSYEFDNQDAVRFEHCHVDMTPEGASKLLIAILDVLNGEPNRAASEQ